MNHGGLQGRASRSTMRFSFGKRQEKWSVIIEPFRLGRTFKITKATIYTCFLKVLITEGLD